MGDRGAGCATGDRGRRTADSCAQGRPIPNISVLSDQLAADCPEERTSPSFEKDVFATDETEFRSKGHSVRLDAGSVLSSRHRSVPSVAHALV